jgi:3-methylfumaryl-CoA hydratase
MRRGLSASGFSNNTHIFTDSPIGAGRTNMIDIEHLQTWIGREQRRSEILSPFPAKALSALLERSGFPREGHPLPPLWHWLYFLEAPLETGTDGHPRRGDFLPPVPLPRRMWAGGSLDILRPLRLGAAAEKLTLVRSVELKSGKSGELVFVNLEHRLSQAGHPCILEEQNLVYREMPAGPAALPAGEPASTTCEWSRTVRPDPVLLFRFSALTYNGHRVHYDRDYATQEEFYSGLVVHAPLLATLLLDLLLRERPEMEFSHFRFRALRPTFDCGLVELRAKREGRTVKFWSADHENYIGMNATATIDGAM